MRSSAERLLTGRGYPAVRLSADASALTREAVGELWELQAREVKEELGLRTAPPSKGP